MPLKEQGWSVRCYKQCLRSAVPNIVATNPAEVITVPDLCAVHTEYHVLAQVFSKDRALSLLPHCPYDFRIDLLPSHPFPTVVYTVSQSLSAGLWSTI